jgi:signal transduction histidine kinase
LKTRLKTGLKARPRTSLRSRLTLEIGTLTLLGVGGLTAWGAWQMQQALLATHEQALVYIAQRFPLDVEAYTRSMPTEAGLAKTVEQISTERVLLWVRSPQGKLLVQSNLTTTAAVTTERLQELQKMEMSDRGQVINLGDRVLLAYGVPLVVQGKTLGKLYLAQDITAEQQQSYQSIILLGLGGMVVSGAVMGAVTLRIRSAMGKLQQMSDMAGSISVEDLGKRPLELHQAPQEIQGLTEAFNLMLQRLSLSWDHQRQFVSDASHELRTPMTIVHGYLQGVLRRSQNLTPYQLEALEAAASESERTVRLLQDLLELARADTQHLRLHLEAVEVQTLLEEVAMMTRKVGSHQIEIHGSPVPLKIRADRDRLKQVLLNLVDNAMKYSDVQDPIQLIAGVGDAEQPQDRPPEPARVGQRVWMQVRDHGIGIPLAHQQRIFERFYRVDEARARSTGGTGLGLAIVKTLVESMAGQVTVSSNAQTGTRFTVSFDRLVEVPAA